jgi:hypothetical protein
MVEQDRQFEEILERRAVPAPRSNLEHRIIEAALKVKHPSQKEAFNPSAWLAAFMRNFALPTPAVALAVVLVFGVFAGVYVQDAYALQEEDMMFLYVENSYEVENWL